MSVMPSLAQAGRRRASRVRPLPGGWVTRVAALVVGLGFIAWDAPFHLSSGHGWVTSILPYLPILALAGGATSGIAVWFLVFVVLITTNDEPSAFVSHLVSTPFTLGLSLYLVPRRPALVVSVLVVASPWLVLVDNTDETDAEFALIVAIANALTCLAGLGLNALRIRSEKSETQIDELRRHQEQIRREERTRLAYELHDIVAHDVTAMAMQARRAKIVNDPAATADALSAISDAAQKALDDLHSLVSLLKDNEGDAPDNADQDSSLPQPSGETSTAEGLIEDIRAVATAIEKAGFRVRLEIEGRVALVPTSMRQALRRTVRELGTNILKHGDPAGEVELTLTVAEAVTISASNALSGKDPIASSSSGIEGIRTRCDVFGGELVTAAHDGRWTTTMTIPLTARTENRESKVLA